VTPVVIWFAFHKATPLRQAWRERRWSFLGHVDCWGATQEGIWFWFNPEAVGTTLDLTTDPVGIDYHFAERIAARCSILQFRPKARQIGLPFHPTMNCASQCGHLVGLRAYTPWGLRRMLLANGATEWNDNAGCEREP